ncbi:hypothetical protein GOP47_0027148 [Adiantum capillus-veneris]|nr:hypothetical protein GOP47_0027148 [Adiantum capillus-veneris]
MEVSHPAVHPVAVPPALTEPPARHHGFYPRFFPGHCFLLPRGSNCFTDNVELHSGHYGLGDGVTSTLTFAAACATAGITVLIDNDLDQCGQNHCGKYEAAAAMAFLSWIMAAPSFLLTFWLLATR